MNAPIIPPESIYLLTGILVLLIITRPVMVFAKQKSKNNPIKNLNPKQQGIIFDIQITKADLKDKDLMATVQSLMNASNSNTAGQVKPGKPNKELELIQGLMAMGKGGPMAGLLPGAT
tara:strand:+ start:1279 stop:1632 length:354 start_codon:yes stop_codon:yes gene_type:complete